MSCTSVSKTALVLAASLIATLISCQPDLARASELAPAEVSCVQPQADSAPGSAYGVLIAGQEAKGKKIATLASLNPAVSSLLGRYEVTAYRQGMQLIYRGEGFDLNISLESFLPTEVHQGQLSAKVPGIGEVRTYLFCRVVEPRS